jgi:hypothetical protein
MNGNEISVIVQAAVTKHYTIQALESIRSILPQAEIVLSTWEILIL